MNRPRAVGLPALLLGLMQLRSSAGTLAAAGPPTGVDGLAALSGTVGGCALALVGLALLRGWGEFAVGGGRAGH